MIFKGFLNIVVSVSIDIVGYKLCLIFICYFEIFDNEIKR